MEQVSAFIDKYMPGFEWLVFLIVAHLILSTIAHIAKKDFKISEWPKFLSMWLLFMVGIVAVNGVVAVSSTLASASLLLPVVNTLQAMMYAMYFGYYLDNIFKHLNMMGLPVDSGLIEFIKNMSSKIRSTFIGG